MLILLLACAESEPVAATPTPAGTTSNANGTGSAAWSPVDAGPDAGQGKSRTPTPSPLNNIAPPGSQAQSAPPPVVREEGPWGIRTQEGGEVVGALLSLCKRVDTLDGRCLNEGGAPTMAWQEIPVANVKGGVSQFYWPNETKGQESWFISVPKNDAPRPPEVKWKETFGFSEEPQLSFKGIDVTAVGGEGFAELKHYFHPLGPFIAPTDQSWSYSGGYLGNEKDSCFELTSKDAKGASAKAVLSVDYPAPLNGTVSEVLCAPSAFAWPSTQSGTTLTVTYTRAGTCACPADTIKYGYTRKYQ